MHSPVANKPVGAILRTHEGVIMQLTDPQPGTPGTLQFSAVSHPQSSAVSWGAISAGAAAAAALSLILLVLGTGLGLAVLSPWSAGPDSAERLGWASIAWITLTALAASGLGGYLAGRLRVRWAATPIDEVYFRDTAHGLLAWALATLATAALLAGAIGTVLGGGAKVAVAGLGAAGPTLATSLRSGEAQPWLFDYYASQLDRPDPGAASDTDPAALVSPQAVTRPGTQRELRLILSNAWATEHLSSTDADYLSARLAARTGLSVNAAQARVQAVWNELQQRRTAMRELAEQARKVAAHTALWLFISLLGGAFVSSWLATAGGRQRDR